MRNKFLAVTLLILTGAFARADTLTPRVGLTQPTTSFGDIWGIKMNNNFALIDASIAGQSVSNIFTSTNAFAGAVYFPFMSPGSCLSVDSTGLLIGQSCGGGGGSSSLQVMVGSVIISTPTGTVRFSSNFTGSLAGSATAQIDVNPNMTYFIQNSTSSQTATFYVAAGTATNLYSNQAIIANGTYGNATISGPTLAYSSGTFLNSVAIGTTNVNGQPFRIIDTNGSGVSTFESSAGTTLHWNLKNNTSGASPNIDMSILGTGGDAATGAVAFDGLIRTANNMYFSAGGPTAGSGLKITPTGGVFVTTFTISSLTPNQCLQTTTGGQVVTSGSACGSGGGGGSSSLAVTTGTIAGFSSIASTPTAIINFNNKRFSAVLTGSATAYVDILSTQTFSSMTVTNALNTGELFTPLISNTPGTTIAFHATAGPGDVTMFTMNSNYPNGSSFETAQSPFNLKDTFANDVFTSGATSFIGGLSSGWTVTCNGSHECGLTLNSQSAGKPMFLSFEGVLGSNPDQGNLWYSLNQLMFAIDRPLNVEGTLVVGSTQTAKTEDFTYPQNSQFRVYGSTVNAYSMEVSTFTAGYTLAVDTNGFVRVSGLGIKWADNSISTSAATAGGAITSVVGTNGITASGSPTSTVSVSSVSLSTQTTGVLAAANGGTGQSLTGNIANGVIVIGNGSVGFSNTRINSGTDCSGANQAINWSSSGDNIGCVTISGGASTSSVTVHVDGKILTANATDFVLNSGAGIALVASTPTANSLVLTIPIDNTDVLERKTDQAGTDTYCYSATGNTTYACNLNPALTLYTTGQCLTLVTDTSNVTFTTATLNVNTLGAFSIFNSTGGALVAGNVTQKLPEKVCLSSGPSQAWIMPAVLVPTGSSGGVTSISTTSVGGTPITGAVQILPGTNITLTQSGQGVTIASSGGASSNVLYSTGVTAGIVVSPTASGSNVPVVTDTITFDTGALPALGAGQCMYVDFVSTFSNSLNGGMSTGIWYGATLAGATVINPNGITSTESFAKVHVAICNNPRVQNSQFNYFDMNTSTNHTNPIVSGTSSTSVNTNSASLHIFITGATENGTGVNSTNTILGLRVYQ